MIEEGPRRGWYVPLPLEPADVPKAQRAASLRSRFSGDGTRVGTVQDLGGLRGLQAPLLGASRDSASHSPI